MQTGLSTVADSGESIDHNYDCRKRETDFFEVLTLLLKLKGRLSGWGMLPCHVCLIGLQINSAESSGYVLFHDDVTNRKVEHNLM